MLTLQGCRQLLHEQPALTDADVGAVRDQLYTCARIAVEAFLDSRRGDAARTTEGKTSVAPAVDGVRRESRFRDAVALLPPGERVAVLERAAIIEFDGGVERDQAERHAVLRAVRETEKEEAQQCKQRSIYEAQRMRGRSRE